MAVVKKAQSITRVIQKRIAEKPQVKSVRQPSTVQEMGDVSFGTLSETSDGLIMSYDSASDKFVLVSPDQVLSRSSEDNDIPDDFVTQLEQELDLGTIQVETLDGGTF